MRKRFSFYNGDGCEHLLCQNCKSGYLHHFKVEVFDREEDATDGVHVTISEGVVKMDISLEGNPSPQSHGLNIHFNCEGCSAISVLSIAQHKGASLIDLNSVNAVPGGIDES